DAAICADELHYECPLAEFALDQLMRNDLGVRTGEVEACAAILGLHARRERAVLTQVDRGGGRVPVVGRGVPLLDPVGRGPIAPAFLDRGVTSRLDRDLHRVSSTH